MLHKCILTQNVDFDKQKIKGVDREADVSYNVRCEFLFYNEVLDMKTAFGKLTTLAFVLLVGILLLAPMRAGVEDMLKTNIEEAQMAMGESLIVRYELYAETAQTVVYTSDDPSVASVDQLGNVTAVSPGKTYIRLQAQGGARAEVRIDVTGVPVTFFDLNTDLLELDKGEVSGLSCVFNNGVSDTRVEWMSADPAIAKVDAAGRISAVGAGETYVVATTPGGHSAAATVRVRVRGTAVQITPENLKVGVGASFPLSVRYLPEDATERVASWQSNNPDVLSIDRDGVIRAVSVGTAKVTVNTDNGLSGYTMITVESAAKDLQINPTDLTIERGDSHLLEAWFIGNDGLRDDNLDHHIEWTSSDPTVASVDNGLVTGLSSGLSYITASADGIRSVCAVRVRTTVREVNLNMTELYLLREQTGEPFRLKASVVPEDSDNTKVSFESDNRLVAGVSADGLVTLTGGYGTAVITATAASGAQATFAVHVVTQLPETAADADASVDAAVIE